MFVCIESWHRSLIKEMHTTVGKDLAEKHVAPRPSYSYNSAICTSRPAPQIESFVSFAKGFAYTTPFHSDLPKLVLFCLLTQPKSVGGHSRTLLRDGVRQLRKSPRNLQLLAARPPGPRGGSEGYAFHETPGSAQPRSGLGKHREGVPLKGAPASVV